MDKVFAGWKFEKSRNQRLEKWKDVVDKMESLDGVKSEFITTGLRQVVEEALSPSKKAQPPEPSLPQLVISEKIIPELPTEILIEEKLIEKAPITPELIEEKLIEKTPVTPELSKEILIEEKLIEKTRITQELPKEILIEEKLIEKTPIIPELTTEILIEEKLIEKVPIIPELPKEILIEEKLIEKTPIIPELPTEILIEEKLIKKTPITPELPKEIKIEEKLIEKAPIIPKLPTEILIEEKLIKKTPITPELPKEITQDKKLIEDIFILPPSISELSKEIVVEENIKVLASPSFIDLKQSQLQFFIYVLHLIKILDLFPPLTKSPQLPFLFHILHLVKILGLTSPLAKVKIMEDLRKGKEMMPSPIEVVVPPPTEKVMPPSIEEIVSPPPVESIEKVEEVEEKEKDKKQPIIIDEPVMKTIQTLKDIRKEKEMMPSPVEVVLQPLTEKMMPPSIEEIVSPPPVEEIVLPPTMEEILSPSIEKSIKKVEEVEEKEKDEKQPIIIDEPVMKTIQTLENVQTFKTRHPDFKPTEDDIKLKKKVEDVVKLTFKDAASLSTDKTYTRSHREIAKIEYQLLDSLLTGQSSTNIVKSFEFESQKLAEKLERRTASVTWEMYKECQDFFRTWGIPCIFSSNHEAEAFCVSLTDKGFTDAVVSDDMDATIYGDGPVLRQFLKKNKPIQEILPAKIRELLKFSNNQYIDFCILCGTDFAGTIRNIGPINALKMVQEHENIENILTHLKPQLLERYEIDSDEFLFNYNNVIFNECKEGKEDNSNSTQLISDAMGSNPFRNFNWQ
ncbi:11719_t:CDS:2 [Diversispora eburnea]|uniref:11719_t:CDS:1 n=1 Tax=Diversispora eburnea TaxID=1213867 RepID=A0A9N8V713_9GLOM|nr:11719_t:CDS:2 [Diversispora eburnea]